jgi:SAM-dependent methyltransferase
MPPTDPVVLLRRLEGSGIEIGAFHSPLAVGPRATVEYVDLFQPEIARRFFPEVPEEAAIVVPDIVAPADRLPLPASSQAFVLSSHLLEHLADPIGALVEWHRVLKPGGTLFLRLPDQRGTFDKARARTRLTHLVQDHAEPPDHPARRERDLEHYREWAQYVNELSDPAQIDFWARLLARGAYPIHYHCWIPEDLRELLAHLASRERASFRTIAEHARDDRYEFTIVATAEK